MSVWTKELVTLLIEEYRRYPNLYCVKSVNFKNRNLRRQALDKITASLKVVVPAITSTEIQSKFQALKQNATKEYKKWYNSMKSGTGEDEVYYPSLWYFDLINYIFDDVLPRKATDTFDLDMDDQEPIVHQNDTEEDTDVELSALVEDSNDTVTFHAVVNDDGTIIPTPKLPNTPSTSRCSSEVTSVTPNLPNTGSTSRCTSVTSVPPLRLSLPNCAEEGNRKRKKPNKERDFLETVTGNLKTLSNKLTQNTIEPQTDKTREGVFSEYVKSKLNMIVNDEIKDEVEEQIICILNKALKKSRELNNL